MNIKSYYLTFLIVTTVTWEMTRGNFHEGDFVHMYRRGQFHGQRTNWHDILGRHCPRFNKDSLVAIPIPQPLAVPDPDEYKIQFSFDHGRIVTPWVTVISKKTSPSTIFHSTTGHSQSKLSHEIVVPFIKFVFYKDGDELIRVHLFESHLTELALKNNQPLLDEYRNATYWPKRIILRYDWESLDEVDVERGILVMLICGLVMVTLSLSGIVFTFKDKLKDFMIDLTSENPSNIIHKNTYMMKSHDVKGE